MYRTRIISLFMAMALLLCGQPALADNRYQVEIVVFEHLTTHDPESWPAADDEPRWPQALDLFDGGSDSRFTALSSAGYKMGGVYRVLRSSRNYRPILHLAWVQDGLPAARTQAVHLRSKDGQIKGQLELEQSRFLHVNLDLIYPFGDTEGRYARIKERRRLKLKELHYFDNPVFGAIIQVTRADS